MEALLKAPVSPAAREAAAPLIEGWVERFQTEDETHKTVAVELGFHYWLDENTLVIGVQDRIAQDSSGYLGCEWKTAKEPKRNKDGSDSAWWNEDVWLKEISSGPQIAIYALAMQKGIYFGKDVTPFRLGVQTPRIMVRAAVKASDPRFWPEDSRKSVWKFGKDELLNVEAALLAKAETIRALKAQPNVPWQLPGKQCHEFNRECQFLETFCKRFNPPDTEPHALFFNPHDPAYEAALPFVDKSNLENEDLVILSASSYQLASSCLEKFRIISGARGEKDESVALATGTAFHAGIAEYYRYMKENNH